MESNILHGLSHQFLVKHQDIPLHRDVVSDLIKLQRQAELQGIDLRLVSAYRSFERQKKIWNKKLTINPDITEESLICLIKKCMRWSAIPGFSRHHWGTDFDIYDHSALEKNPGYKIQLETHEYDTDGIFSHLNEWLTQHMKENKCAFFRPYEKDLGGVAREPWHIGHQKISQPFFNSLTLDNALYFLSSPECEDIIGIEYLLENIEELYNKYIINITTD